MAETERTLVVVEDDANIADLLDLYLRDAGFRVLQAAHGERGLQLIEQHRPALVLLDIGLPDIDGFEVCRRVRARSNVPVLFLTARDGELDRPSAWSWAPTTTSPNRSARERSLLV